MTLRPFPLLALIVLAPLAHAAPIPNGETGALIHLGAYVLLTWASSASAPVTSYDVYGVANGVHEYLGTVDGLLPVFLAPAGYDSYVIASSTNDQQWTSEKWCLVVDHRSTPPRVGIDTHCGSARVARGAAHPMLP